MVRSRAVVAEAFAGPGTEEDGAGVAQQRFPARRLRGADLEMLGCDAVRKRAGLFEIARADERAAGWLKEIRAAGYQGAVVSGQDLRVY